MRFAAVKPVEQQSTLEAAGGRRPGMGDEVDLNQPGGGSFQSPKYNRSLVENS
jgi:hypothetical protein